MRLGDMLDLQGLMGTSESNRCLLTDALLLISLKNFLAVDTASDFGNTLRIMMGVMKNLRLMSMSLTQTIRCCLFFEANRRGMQPWHSPLRAPCRQLTERWFSL